MNIPEHLLARELRGNPALFRPTGGAWGLAENVAVPEPAPATPTDPLVAGAISNDERERGKYRTKPLILERFDATTAAAAGRPYEPALEPSPAHPSQTHDASTRPTFAGSP